MRYWLYLHDADGEIVRDYGEFADFDAAQQAVAHALLDQHYPRGIYRIVDNYNDHQTCWIAGPVDYMKHAFPA